MKYIFIYLLLVCSAFTAYSQSSVKIYLVLSPVASKTTAKDSAGKNRQDAEFGGVGIGWMRFLERNLKANVSFEKGAPKE